MGWFRSEEMNFTRFTIPEHLAYRVVDTLGRTGAVQFVDLNPDVTAFHRRYKDEIKRCAEMERQLKYLDELLEQQGVDAERTSVANFLSEHDHVDLPRTRDAVLQELERKFGNRYSEMRDQADTMATLASAYNDAVEKMIVVDAAVRGLRGDPSEGVSSSAVLPGSQSKTNPLVELTGGADAMSFDYVMGTLDPKFTGLFERTIFRATRGNCLVTFHRPSRLPVDKKTGQSVSKVVFVILHRSATIAAKVQRICDSFGAATWTDLPDIKDARAVEAFREEHGRDVSDTHRLLTAHQERMDGLLNDIAVHLATWKMEVRREKAVYHALNMMQRSGSTLIAKGWMVAARNTDVCDALAALNDGTAAVIVGEEAPPTGAKFPTHFETNKVTSVIQDIVDTYGVPRYREANPALFTAFSFPFLFGVMYGDVGHATVLTVVAIVLIAMEKRLLANKPHELVSMVFGGRYMLLFMGLFGVYNGLIYNDSFSIALDIFGTRWRYSTQFNNATGENMTVANLDGVYPFGSDPEWHIAANELSFSNSLKMKLSVILGVTQMTVGVLLKVANSLHFRSRVDLFCEAIPQLLFILSLFGYMIFLIFYKWCVDWDVAGRDNAPSLINTMIAIALQPGSVDMPLFSGQATLQVILLLIAFISVPWMLIPKPIFEFKHHKHELEQRRLLAGGRRGGRGSGTSDDEEAGLIAGGPAAAAMRGMGDDEHSDAGSVEEGDEEHSFGNLFIHQTIETIEYVLGCVSNTASYLRLWALSLAHSELAKVFWEKTMPAAITLDASPVVRAVAIYIAFAIFACITIGVLLLMDALECFLHALRLHWVEFQNKFYKADGYKFEPFKFDTLLKDDAK